MKVDDSILDAIIEAASVLDEASVPQYYRVLYINRHRFNRMFDKRQRRRIRRMHKLNQKALKIIHGQYE